MLHASHGEVNFYQLKKGIPKNVKKIIPKKGYYKVADSEVTGNHHLVEDMDGVSLYQHEENENLMYMRNEKPAKVKCIIESRHDTIEIPAGNWEIEGSYEYDYLTEEVRIAKD